MTTHLVICGLLLAASCVVYGKKSLGRMLICLVMLVVLVALAIPPVVWIDLIALTAASLVCEYRGVRRARFALLGIGVTIVVYAGAMAHFSERHRELLRLRAQYPPISLAERLSYETSGPAAANAPYRKPDGLEILTPQIAGEIERFEKHLWTVSGQSGYQRHRSLAKLYWTHTSLVQEFVASQGFGVSRMRPFRPSYFESLEIPELAVVPYPDQLEPIDVASTRGLIDEGREPMVADVVLPESVGGPLRDFHETNAAAFSNPVGFGCVVDRENVLGFQSHGFREAPKIPAELQRSRTWRIEGLELVSLLKHDPPAAYVSNALPSMHELVGAPVRTLQPFERRALDKLRAGEELVVEQERDELRMLGSLRAVGQCLECHSVRRGNLLGAFTYRLRRTGAIRQRPARSDGQVL